MPSKIFFKQKLALVLFGIFLFFILLEASLRLGGFILSSIQEHRNQISIQQKGAYRILCIGESTTAGQYPQFLEEILNQSGLGIKFSVIDKGVNGATTIDITEQLDANLARYHPDMVIAMMGINDSGELLPYNIVSKSWLAFFVKSLRTYKLMKIIWKHFLSKTGQAGVSQPPLQKNQKQVFQIGLNIAYADSTATDDQIMSAVDLGRNYQKQGKYAEAEAAFYRAIELNPKVDYVYEGLGRVFLERKRYAEAEENFRQALRINPKNNFAYEGLGWIYWTRKKYLQAEQAFQKAIDIYPQDSQAIIELGRVFQEQEKYPQAQEAYLKAIALDPRNDFGYESLGRLFLNLEKYPQAEENFLRALKINPKNNFAYEGLGWIYHAQRKLPLAEAAFKKAVEADPRSGNSTCELGWFYWNQGRIRLAEEFLKKSIELNPLNDRAYFGLAWIYRSQGKFRLAQDLMKKAIKLNPGNDRAYAALAVLYQDSKNEIAVRYSKMANSLREYSYNPGTAANYHKLKEVLDQRGVRLVCVQYPVRKILPLEIIFQGEENVIFVDNEKIFKEAVRQEGFSVYFRDMFGGDFGHCTEKGNRLLAQNIADTLLKEVFKKSAK